MQQHLTIVDDMQENLMSYKDLLEDDYQLELIQEPANLMNFLSKGKTDLILLDLHMPKINGFDLYGKFKESHPNLPVIFLSGDPSEESMVKGLDLGADDFIVKPVSLKQLIARINNKISNKLTRKSAQNNDVISIGSFKLYTQMQMAEIEGKKVALTPIEFKIINLLVNSPNKIFSRNYITELIWPNVHVQTQNIDTHLSNLRRKLAPFSKNIKTIKSRGYILRI